MVKNFVINHKLPIVFFAVYFVVACCIFSDYGVGWDEDAQRLANGQANVAYIVDGNGENLIKYGDKYHGPIWEIFLYTVEVVLKVDKLADIYALRHFLNFLLFFVGTFYLFLLFVKLNIHKTIALISCCFYVLLPRLFEDSFINSKDTVFLSVVVISNFYLINWLQKRTYQTLFLFAGISGIAIALRILGILIPIFSIIAYFLLSRNKLKDSLNIVLYLFSTYCVMVLCWPVLWEGPIYHFIEAFKEMKKFPWEGTNLYVGKMLWATDLPWHYLPVWFLITTPIFLTVIFSTAVFVLSFQAFREIVAEKKLHFTPVFYVYQLVLFLTPFIMVVVFNSVVYDGWRHVFFVASPFIVIVAMGLELIFKTRFFNKLRYYFYSVLFLAIGYLVFWNINNHPYQNVYFNTLITTRYAIRQSFDLDYWGLAYKQGLEKLVGLASSDTIIYSANHYPGYQAQFTIQSNKTILFTNAVNKADYFLTNYRWHPEDYPYKKIDSILVDGYEIMGIYKVKND